MLKSLLLLPTLFMPLINNQVSSNGNEAFSLAINERGNYTITGVKEGYKDNKEIKIYYDEDQLIDEIDDNAFVTCTNLETLVLSYSITHVTNDALIDSIETIKYTGSEDEYLALGIDKEFENIYYYASDEGFINFWNEYIRPTKDSNICNITTQTFYVTKDLYTELSISERIIVDESTDLADEKIGDSMKALIEHFKISPQPSNRSTTWNQKGAISFIIVIAVIGMTSICVFYLMKTKQIIE